MISDLDMRYGRINQDQPAVDENNRTALGLLGGSLSRDVIKTINQGYMVPTERSRSQNANRPSFESQDPERATNQLIQWNSKMLA